MKPSMYKRRVRRSAEPDFPYGKSVIGASGLIVAFMLVLSLIADPGSGEIKSPALACLALAALPVAIITVFYAEFRVRNRRSRTHVQGPNQEAEQQGRQENERL
jgi:hypothetical protein